MKTQATCDECGLAMWAGMYFDNFKTVIRWSCKCGFHRPVRPGEFAIWLKVGYGMGHDVAKGTSNSGECGTAWRSGLDCAPCCHHELMP